VSHGDTLVSHLLLQWSAQWDHQKFGSTGFCRLTWGGRVTDEIQGEGLQGGHQLVA